MEQKPSKTETEQAFDDALSASRELLEKGESRERTDALYALQLEETTDLVFEYADEHTRYDGESLTRRIIHGLDQGYDHVIEQMKGLHKEERVTR
jgi:hypothetical protein